MSLTLARALRMQSSSCCAFVGAGGKTTAVFQLARQLSAPVIVTATSHLGVWQIPLADRHIVLERVELLEALEDGFEGVILITGAIEEDRTRPVPDDLLRSLHDFCSAHSIPLLIEADGSRQKPLKAWAEHEPPVPAFSDLVVQVAGLKGLGMPLDSERVHRPELFGALSGLAPGERTTPAALMRVLTHPDGGMRNAPAGARKVVLLNQADTPEQQSTALGITASLLRIYDSVIISSLRTETIFAAYEPIAGIVLAAGEARRFGQAKQLLDWHGEPFVHAVARKASEAGLSPVIVVSGANAGRVEAAVRDLDVTLARNHEWESGQASSIKAGLEAVVSRADNTRMEPTHVGGAVFLLADQPQVSTSVIRALVQEHARGLHPIVAPMVIDRRANPVLFDRDTFHDLNGLEGDVGGRAIFHKHRVEYLPWHDDSLLMDVDTPEQYARLIADDTL